MNQKFQAAITQKDDVCYVKLSGVIDEDNSLAGLVDQIPAGTAVINVGEIERINSCGVRDWVNWLGKIEKNNTSVVLVECSPAIVAQINLVHNFTGGGAVKSFFAPYFCPACDLEKVLLIDAAEMSGATPQAPTCRCDECDGVMDFDDMEESYFAFVSSGKKVAKDAKVEAVLKEMAPTDGKGERKIRSRVGITGVTGGSPQAGPNTPPSLPSVPSLPSITRPGSGVTPSNPPLFGQSATSPGSRPGTGPGSSPGGNPSVTMSTLDIGASTRLEASAAAMSPGTGKPKLAMILVVALLLVAIGLLAYVVLFGQSKPKVKVHEMPQTSVEVVRPPVV